MSDFVRTTGGLLQLRSKQPGRYSHERLAAFARSIGITVPPEPPRKSTTAPTRPAAPGNCPMDWETDLPEVFR